MLVLGEPHRDPEDGQVKLTFPTYQTLADRYGVDKSRITQIARELKVMKRRKAKEGRNGMEYRSEAPPPTVQIGEEFVDLFGADPEYKRPVNGNGHKRAGAPPKPKLNGNGKKKENRASLVPAWQIHASRLSPRQPYADG